MKSVPMLWGDWCKVLGKDITMFKYEDIINDVYTVLESNTKGSISYCSTRWYGEKDGKSLWEMVREEASAPYMIQWRILDERG